MLHISIWKAHIAICNFFISSYVWQNSYSLSHLKKGWSYLEVHSPVRDKGEEDWEDFHQSFHLLDFLFWKFPSIGHFGTVEQGWLVAFMGIK